MLIKHNNSCAYTGRCWTCKTLFFSFSKAIKIFFFLNHPKHEYTDSSLRFSAKLQHVILVWIKPAASSLQAKSLTLQPPWSGTFKLQNTASLSSSDKLVVKHMWLYANSLLIQKDTPLHDSHNLLKNGVWHMTVMLWMNLCVSVWHKLTRHNTDHYTVYEYIVPFVLLPDSLLPLYLYIHFLPTCCAIKQEQYKLPP